MLGSRFRFVTKLPNLPRHPLSVISILFNPKLPSPAIKATCLRDHSLINFLLLKLFAVPIIGALNPNLSNSTLMKVFKSNIS